MLGRLLRSLRLLTPPVQEGEDSRNEDQRRNCRQQEAADDGASQRSILFAALARAKRHGNHANDHRQSCHADWTESCGARLDSGEYGVAMMEKALLRERNHQD